MKKVFSVFLCVVLLFFNTISTYAATPSQNDLSVTHDQLSKTEEILNAYQDIIANTRMQNDIQRDAQADEIIGLLNECKTAICNNGGKAYVVNSSNYHSLQTELGMDFEKMGLSPEYTYLISFEGDASIAADSAVSPFASVSPEFTYSYNGSTYRMRYCIVTAADDPAFSKASDCNLLNSSSSQIISNCLNTAITAWLSAVYTPLGTVASICGLNISNFAPVGNTTLRLNCGTNWTREFTEVYSTYNQSWAAGSCVEYAKVASYMSGYYYNSATNKMEKVPQNESRSVLYSSHYSDRDWKLQKAIVSFINGSGCTYDVTGAVSYKYGNEVKITHGENF